MESLKWILVLTLFINFHAGNCRVLTNRTEGFIINAEGNKYDVVAELEALKRQFVELKGKMQAFTFEDPGPYDVYFDVVLEHDVRGLAPGQKVVYDNVFTNGGNGYTNTTGVFTVPTAGVYLFLFFCNSLKAGHTDLVMKKNGNVKANCVVEPAYDGEDESSGNVYTGRLTLGDEVWVEVYSSDKSDADLKKYFNTFSGVLIHR